MATRCGSFIRSPRSSIARPTDPGNKTDDIDLAAIHRAAVSGCALMQAPVDPIYRELQLLIRQRRDWVRKTSMLCCQIREYLHSAYPGYAACFATPWHSDVMITLVRALRVGRGHVAGRRVGLVRGVARTQNSLPALHPRSRAELGAAGAARPIPPRFCSAASPWPSKTIGTEKPWKIQALERDSAAYLAKTPYILLLSFPASTSSPPPTSPARWGRSRTT